MDGCLFCRIVAGEIPATRVHEDERTVAFLDLFPASRGHLLVVPRAHAADALEADPEDLAACARVAAELGTRARARLGADGITLQTNAGAAAGQTVFHLHVHVVPRYADGPRMLAWQPGAATPDELAALAEALRAD